MYVCMRLLSDCREVKVKCLLDDNNYENTRESLESPFSDAHEWRYENICSLLGAGVGAGVSTQGEFEQRLAAAFSENTQLHIILNILLNPEDRSPGMIRFAHHLGKKLATDKP